MRNKLLILACVIVTAFTLVACGNSETVGDTSNTSQEEITNNVDTNTDTPVSSDTENPTAEPTPTETPEPVHEHSYTSAITKEATCTELGETTYTCDCGDTYKEDIAKISHTESDWIVVKEVEGTENGLQHKVCTVCGVELATEEIYPEVVASGVLTDATIEWKIIGTTLYVSGTGAIPDFSTSPATVKHFPDKASELRDWQFYDEIVEKIVIEEGITKLGKNNFAYFRNTTEIIFADSVVEIGKWACTGMGLYSIDFNNIKKLSDQSFGELLNMTTLRIPGSLETISAGCFAFCNNLQEVYIEEGVKAIKELAFTTESGHWNCSIHLPESVTDFPSDTFNHDTTIYVKAGSKAEKLLNEFASRYNITVIVE